ncbi:MAG: ABC transporter permease [Desulfurococcaceae archaeon]|jgi:peptide/nickel transport system permease protein/oligopeptide transport system permease protein|nr:ABC transporter permease [Desulfurococcaceae archaeon]
MASSLSTYLFFRFLQAIVTFFGAMILFFLIVRLLPGDPARLLAGPEASEEDVARIREALGLNKPIYEQLISYLTSIMRGDLGISIKYGTPVLNEILARLPYTIALALVAEAIAVAIAIPLGVLAALKPRSILAYAASLLGILGTSLPVFWVGLMLIFIFAVELKVLPSSGAESPKHIVLPALTLAFFLTGNLTRMTRAAVLEALSSNHVLTALAKGLPFSKVLLRHVLRVSLIPILTIISLQLGALLGGAIITETIFAWPGIGSLLVDSLFFRDYVLAQGIIMFIVGVFILLNLVTDIAYALVDPRIREVLWRVR